jgi:hypothetical protein
MKFAAAIDRRAAFVSPPVAIPAFHDASNGVANGSIAANHLR